LSYTSSPKTHNAFDENPYREQAQVYNPTTEEVKAGGLSISG
jgi:hypothetical protein